MITIILFTLIGVIIAIFIFWRNYRIFDYLLIEVILNTILLALVGFIVGLMVMIALPAETIEKKVCSYNIINIQDNNSTSGHFILGTGRVNDEMVYSFYYENNGQYRLKQVDVDMTVIQYDSIARIEKYKTVKTESTINLFAYDSPNERYVIFVPRGTIIANYNLDAQ